MKLVSKIFLLIFVVAFVFGCGAKTSGIEGKVLDGKGQPMSGVKVIAKQVQPIKGYEQFETTTGSDGTFTLKGLYPASDYTIEPQQATGKTSVKITAKSGPEGQTGMLPAPMAIRFMVSNDGVITDSNTGLQWVPAQDRPVNWFEAQNYAQSLSLGGGGWRLPTRSELESIYDKSLKSRIDPVFNIHNNWVWTSEIRDTYSAWNFGFLDDAKEVSSYFRDRSSPAGYALRGNGTRILAVRSPK